MIGGRISVKVPQVRARALKQEGGEKSENRSENANPPADAKLRFQQGSGLSHTRRGTAIFAGGDAGQGDELTPTESRASGTKFFGDSAIEFFRVERAILANSVAQQEIENGARVVAEFAITMNESRGMSLQVLADGIVCFTKQSRAIRGFDLREVAWQWERSPIEEIAAAVGAVERHLICAEDQTSESVSGITDTSQIAPGASGIARMNADAVAMDAAGRFAGRFFTRRPPHVAKDELVGSERNSFADRRGREPFRKGRGRGFGGLFGCRFENGLAELVDPGIFG
jgi:hypothetical protein